MAGIEAERAVNQAFSMLLVGYGWQASQEAVVVVSCGAATLLLAKEIYSFALDYRVDWQRVTLAEAISSVRQALQQTYPFLDSGIAYRLGDHFAYAWK